MSASLAHSFGDIVDIRDRQQPRSVPIVGFAKKTPGLPQIQQQACIYERQRAIVLLCRTKYLFLPARTTSE